MSQDEDGHGHFLHFSWCGFAETNAALITTGALEQGEKMDGSRWTREELLFALSLYLGIPFGRFHQHNPEIKAAARALGRKPGAVAMKLCNFASLDPSITDTGRTALSRVSRLDKEIWAEMQSNPTFIDEINNAHNKYLPPESETNRTPFKDDNINRSTTKTVETQIRIGQNYFRRVVLSAYDFKCCITVLPIKELLVASHIVPWKVDEKNRLNPHNGLCLSILHDKAFDIGMLTITEDMTVKVSKEILTCSDPFTRSFLKSYDGKKIQLPSKFVPCPDFLEHHRTHIFRSG